jgi:hypothetical protein
MFLAWCAWGAFCGVIGGTSGHALLPVFAVTIFFYFAVPFAIWLEHKTFPQGRSNPVNEVKGKKGSH